MNGFDFATSEINEALVRQLHRCDFIDEANNIVLVGGPGTGKTRIATTIGSQAIEHHHKRGPLLLHRRVGQRRCKGVPGRSPISFIPIS
ncbi:DNA replication protein DnaC [Rhizobium mongolense]|uniref:DNA replication protein DnaC n=1 Tax=Rhizobium mongolense TaxID=57676 RepID=A0ABR6IYH9_9HYPH|nr:DNA replication protein DnaC [Rhizobium mongolense]